MLYNLADRRVCRGNGSKALEEAFNMLGLSSVKPVQHEAVAGIIEDFVILPTGFGKSTCYQCLLFVYNKLFPCKGSLVVIVVTPLKAIMKDCASALKDQVGTAL